MRKSVQICGLAFLLLLTHAAHVQAQEQEDVVKVKSNLVNIDVIVKDKKGKYISDLKPEDFTITEDGQPQKLEFFDAPVVRIEVRKPGETASAPSPTTAKETPTATRNYVALVLDSQTTDITNLKPVREGAIKYIREHITDADAVAILSVTNGLQMLQPFTQDKARLIASVEQLGSPDAKSFEQKDIAENIGNIREFLKNNDTSGPITSTGGGSAAARVLIARAVLAQFIQLRTTLSLQQSRPVLAALAAIAEGLRPIPEKKTVVLFSQGFVTPAVLDWQVQSTIEIANRANVAIYIIDSAGLRAGAPTSGALVPGSPLAGVSAITNQEQQPVPHLTFAEYLRLATLAPGRYQAVIETKDMVTRKSTKQEAAFEIVP